MKTSCAGLPEKLIGRAADRLAATLANLPLEPGVYLMRDARAQVIYVGKAINLRTRVRSYFHQSGDSRAFIGLLDSMLDAIEVVVVSDERAALLLENSLIKKYQPRFNSMLRDDKNFLSLRIDLSGSDTKSKRDVRAKQFPRLSVTRRVKRDGARYFGPYTSALAVRETMKLVNQHFGLRSCTDRTFAARRRPCILHQMHRCSAPCTQAVDAAEYRQRVDEVALLLGGRHAQLVDSLQARMQAASLALDYERAARLRDQIRAVERVTRAPEARVGKVIDRDVVAYARRGPHMTLAIASMRDKLLSAPRVFAFSEAYVDDDEVLSSLLTQYYQGVNDAELPEEILLPIALADQSALQYWLGQRRRQVDGRYSLRLKVPARGDNLALLQGVQKNAQRALEEAQRRQDRKQESVTALAKRLHLQRLPRSLECFDVSTTQGQSAVASKVRFVDGAPEKAGYRRYIIKQVQGQDDFAMLYEALTRRLKRGLVDQDLPDLLLVDGGKGQLSVAIAACHDLGIHDLQLASIAKARLDTLENRGDDVSQRSEERIFLPNVREPLRLAKHSLERALVEQVRDEAHRFAITFHRQRRAKKSLTSALDAIPGVGPTLRKRLLKHFGSLRQLSQASVEEIAQVKGVSAALAQRIVQQLSGD